MYLVTSLAVASSSSYMFLASVLLSFEVLPREEKQWHISAPSAIPFDTVGPPSGALWKCHYEQDRLCWDRRNSAKVFGAAPLGTLALITVVVVELKGSSHIKPCQLWPSHLSYCQWRCASISPERWSACFVLIAAVKHDRFQPLVELC